MKAYTEHRSRRRGYDGWALMHPEGLHPLSWSVCTTREEARELLDDQKAKGSLLEFRIVKVKVKVEAVESNANQP